MHRHPIHPLLVSLPIGLWILSLVADVIHWTGLGVPSWDDVAFYSMFGGLVAALLAAVPALIDFLAQARARRPQLASGLLRLNLAIVGLYVLNFCLRAYQPAQSLSVWMSVAGITLLAISGWLGGELFRGLHGEARRVRGIRIETRRHSTARSA